MALWWMREGRIDFLRELRSRVSGMVSLYSQLYVHLWQRGCIPDGFVPLVMLDHLQLGRETPD